MGYSVTPFSPQSLFEGLSNEHCDSEQVALQDRAIYIGGYLSDLNAKTIVVENDYTDGDYLEDYVSYYARCYRDYNRRCKRLHFFDINFDELKLKEWITCGDKEAIIEINRHYLGFVVARPLPLAVIGRTVLKTYPSILSNRHRCYTAVKEYQANLYGIQLSVASLAFQEQDTVLAACATVALWSAFHITSKLFESTSPRPAEITRSANGVESSSRAIPSHGLDIRQMAHAIRSLNLEPELIPARPSLPIVSAAYSYLKMGLPVLLGVKIEGRGGHAMTLCGYSLNDHKVNQQEVAGGEPSIPLVGLRVDKFYAHDDQVGPFARLIVKPSASESPVLFEGQWKDKRTGKVLALQPVFLLIPVYNKIRVTYVDIADWIGRLHSVLGFLLEESSNLEWDIYLTTTNEFKYTIKADRILKDDFERIVTRQHPRFIWRATLRGGTVPFMDLLADATDMSRSFPIYEQMWYVDQIRTKFKAKLQNEQLKNKFIKMLKRRFYDFLIKP